MDFFAYLSCENFTQKLSVKTFTFFLLSLSFLKNLKLWSPLEALGVVGNFSQTPWMLLLTLEALRESRYIFSSFKYGVTHESLGISYFVGLMKTFESLWVPEKFCEFLFRNLPKSLH